MKTRQTILILAVIVMTIATFLLLTTALASAQPAPVIPSVDAKDAQTKIDRVSTVGPFATQAVSVTFPPGLWPWYAQDEIIVRPEPPIAGHPTEICAIVINEDPTTPHTATLEFGIANFGIGVPFTTVGVTDVEVPPSGEAEGCVVWVPPQEGHWCIEVLLWQPGAREPERSQRNIDIWEPLIPGQAHDLDFPVGPFSVPGFISFTIGNVMPGWDVSVSPNGFVLDNGVVQTITLTTIPPVGAVLGTQMPVADVEGFLDGETIGGFRKMDTPPVPLHRLREPPYAESEISVSPYPPRAGEPTQICAELFNLSDEPQTVAVEFAVANFGIGLPFTPFDDVVVTIPPGSFHNVCTWWIPPRDGHFCVQVRLDTLGPVQYEPQFSQRNLDVAEPLEPGIAHTLPFPVGNPSDQPATVTLELISHAPDWALELSTDTLPDMNVGEQRIVSLTVVPPPDQPLPDDGQPIVDVEAFIEDELIGGIRKVFRPPVPLHRFPDPPYAEREITVHPYPPLAGEPTEVCVELYNPTDESQTVEVQFSWAHFGIGIPFTPINGPRFVTVPPHSTIVECIHWVPPVSGHVCLQVEMFMEGYEPQRSQRNIDVDEPLEPGVPHERWVPIGNPLQEPVTITLGLIHHLPGWDITLQPDILPNMPPGHVENVLLTVMPPPGVPLPDADEPIVDVEAYAEDQLIGGFRKVFRPPIKLHPWPDPPYAEREITVHPYPPLAGEPSEICVELRNPTPDPHTVWVQFSWANFGIGIPFTPIDGLREVYLPPYSVVNECIHWVPPVSGHVCLQVEMFMDGYESQRSQRNIDVDEPLVPGMPDSRWIPIGNPFDHPATVTLGLIHHLPNWDITLQPDILPDMPPGHVEDVLLTVRPPAGEPLPPDMDPIVDVEAYVDGELIGGFRKVFRPPIQLHPWPDPPYAEREISVAPYPPKAGEPAHVCVELRNPTPNPHTVWVQFSWAHFGIGIPFTPINGLRKVDLPPYSIVNECVHWVPPVSGHVCLQVEMFMEGYEMQRSQRNIDVDEPLEPGVPHERWIPIGNPFQEPMTITLGLVPYLPDWDITLQPDILPNMPPGHVEQVLLTVVPPADEPLPPDGEPIVDVEAFANGELIGGFRKVFRPPVPVHQPQDPVYAEREILVHPYPPRAFEPTELGAEIRNPTDEWQTIEVVFSVAPFGIGLPFEPVSEPIVVEVPPHGMVVPGTVWVAPHGGLWCIQVEIFIPGHEEPFWSRLNLDVGEPLEPNVPHSRPFDVGNPFTEPMTITLGLIPHFPDWGLELSEDVLPDMRPGEVRVVTLTVTPPNDLPADGDPIVDVEAFVEGELLGGFRKIFRPPVPIHRPQDPVYAESEIGVDPYPVIPGQPVGLSVEVFNPTDDDHYVTATFSVAPFGIGLPFSTTGIGPDNPIIIFVPAHGAARGHVVWEPPEGFFGKFCVMVELEMPGHEMVWSQRNVDVGEPLEPGQPHSMTFPVSRGTFTQPVTVTLGLVNHRDDFETDLTSDSFFDVFYEIEIDSDEPVSVTLVVTPSETAPLATGEPIVDVEAFVDGELLGGFRKLDVPPIPLHKPHEKNYAETELYIIPDPPRLGLPAKVGAEMQNNGAVTSTITLEFGYARFGVGIPFTTTGMAPYTRSLELGPMMTDTAWVTWTPTFSGSHCVMVKLIDPDGDYADIVSQRNVWVEERPPCGEERVFTFTLRNHSDMTVTIDLGLITFNVPEDWEVWTEPEGSVEVGPFDELEVEVHVRIPCPGSLLLMYDAWRMYDVQAQAGSVPTIDVEGYVDGKLKGGIEIQFADVTASYAIYLPVVMRDS